VVTEAGAREQPAPRPEAAHSGAGAQQAGGDGDPSGPADTRTGSTLPFTGGDVVALAAMGTVAAAGGIVASRARRRPRRV
jgi:hypothetical protein